MWPIARRTKRNPRGGVDFVPIDSGQSPSGSAHGPGGAREPANAARARQSPDEICELLVARGDWLWAGDELMDAWRAAETEARRAYDAWVRCGGATAYVAYQAEQDRADAAQDTLAEWALMEPSMRER